MKRLSTGKKINSGKDDPAGLISSEKLSAAIAALQAETETLRRADSNATIVEGHTSEVSSMMSELNGLVVASANQGGLSDAESEAYQLQIDSLVSSIQRQGGQAVSSLEDIDLPDNGNAEVETMLNDAMAAAATVASGGANSIASGNYEAAQTAIQTAISKVATSRGEVGSYQKNVIGPQLNSNGVAIENLLESRSLIVDTDFAVETSNRVRSEILTASNMQTLKVAQQQSRHVLSLLS